MKKIFLLCITLTALFGCFRIKLDENQLNEYAKQSVALRLGKFVDSTFTDSTRLDSLVNFKILQPKGIIQDIKMEESLALYLSNSKSEKQEVLPIYEMKNTSHSILLVYGKGLWGNIWAEIRIDRNTLKVVDIEFDHKGETPGMGANFVESVFKDQFIDSEINLKRNTYSFSIMDSLVWEGDYKIDGISGATITTQRAVKMINEGIAMYKNYLKNGDLLQD